MEGHYVRAGAAEGIGIAHRSFNHKMYVQYRISVSSERFQYRHAYGDIWNEKAVHNVKMNVVGSTRQALVNVAAQFCEVR